MNANKKLSFAELREKFNCGQYDDEYLFNELPNGADDYMKRLRPKLVEFLSRWGWTLDEFHTSMADSVRAEIAEAKTNG